VVASACRTQHSTRGSSICAWTAVALDSGPIERSGTRHTVPLEKIEESAAAHGLAGRRVEPVEDRVDNSRGVGGRVGSDGEAARSFKSLRNSMRVSSS
jgi:hypothetical protein